MPPRAGVVAAPLFVLLGAVASAEPAAAPSVPAAMPYDIPYGTPIGLDPARQLVDAAIGEAKKRNWKLNIAVVDPNGDLVAFARMDGAQLASVTISQRKARIATRFRRETRVFAEAMAKGNFAIATLDPELVASPGGFPLVQDGRIVGAIGCSGGTGDQDAIVCKAAIDSRK